MLRNCHGIDCKYESNFTDLKQFFAHWDISNNLKYLQKPDKQVLESRHS